MTTSIARALVCASAVTMALGGCSTTLSNLTGATSCTAIGNAEGVNVDLADVLDLEGGDYFAQVSVPAQGASSIRGFAGNDEYYPSGDVEVDLDGKPLTVDVVVRDESGQQVYTARGTATPQLNQPNGPNCDGKNYYLALLATTSGGLKPLPIFSDTARLDARGRESIALSTGCGLDRIELEEGVYARDGGMLTGPDAGPPPGWNAPYQRGWATRDGDRVLYTDDAGHRETFHRDPALAPPPPCG